MVSFSFFCSFGDNSVLFRYRLVQGPLGTFLLVSLTRSFLLFYFSFFLSPILWLGIFFLFFLLSPTLWLGISFPLFFPLIGNFPSLLFCFLFDWKFSFSFFLWLEIFLLFSFFLLPRVRIMVSQDFGSRLVEWLGMIHVRVWFGSRIKRDAPHYFHDINAKMMIWKPYAKLVMHAPMWTLKCQIFMVMWC